MDGCRLASLTAAPYVYCRSAVLKLVQLLLPIKTPDATSRRSFETVLAELTEEFGGATAYLQSPASGLWQNQGEVDRDRIVMLEVMADNFDREWWTSYRRALERYFGEEEIVIRAISAERV